MIDFENSSVFKLRTIDVNDIREDILRFLIDNEHVVHAFKTIRDQVIMTNKRVIATNVQGITGSKVDYTSIPWSRVQAFSIETAGTFDMDCEIDLFISEIGKVRFEINGSFDLVSFNKLLSEYILR